MLLDISMKLSNIWNRIYSVHPACLLKKCKEPGYDIVEVDCPIEGMVAFRFVKFAGGLK